MFTEPESSPPSTAEVIELAHALGVATEYYTQQGQHVVVAADTLTRVLAALHVDATTEAGRAAAWDRITNGPWRRLLPAVVVARQGHGRQFFLHVPEGSSVTLWIDLEEGDRSPLHHAPHDHATREVDGRVIHELSCDVPSGLPLGWHTIRASLTARDGRVTDGECPLAVTPERLTRPPAMKDGQTWGIMTQLYATRSKESWGLGDLHDLMTLAGWAGQQGAGFVLVNPMHAAEVSPPLAPSPYLPATRRFFNPIYLHIEDIPEYAGLGEADRQRIEQLAAPLRRLNTSPTLLDRDGVWQAKKAALQILLAAPLTADRRAAYDAYRQREGHGLALFTTWCSFAEAWGIHTCDWPEGVRTPAGSAVADFRERFAERIEFFTKLQWLLDEQFARVQAAARAAGMTAGIVHDLAVGVHPEGADAWALQDLLAHNISVGAPPDMYNQLGQDWSQPPWRPDMLEAAAYVPYRDMLRTILRHSGGIRVDHALGLFRLWWIPRDTPAARGTYIKYDHEALVGILALEAQRAGGFVVGEDLGTFDGWVRTYLEDRGIAGTSVLWFEGEHGQPLPPERWRENCLATVTVHDLPPTAGYIGGEHVRLRQQLGLLTSDADQEWDTHWRWLVAWENLLRDRGLLAPSIGRATDFRQEVVEALYRLVAGGPCRLIAVAVPDLVGDTRAQNQPGTFREYPNWQIPTCRADGVPLLLEDLHDDEQVAARCRRLLHAVGG